MNSFRTSSPRLLVLVTLSVGIASILADTPRAPWTCAPHLLLDRAWVVQTTNAERCVCPPARLPEPIVTGYEDGCFQPYLTVVRDPQTRRFRLWYGVPRTAGNTGESSVAYLESDDGIHWQRPHRVLKDPAPIQFGVSVIDEGPDYPDPTRRYKFGWWKNGGLQVAASANGLDWTPIQPGVVLSTSHDITSIHWDPLRRRYLALVSEVANSGPYRGLRIPHQSVSDDLVHWRTPWCIVTPDTNAPIEKGETQFYGMNAVLARGDLLVSFVKVLRDDLNCEPDKTASDLHDPNRPFAGIGYSVVAWSRDGEHWSRETAPFLDRNPQPGTWDRAMAWIDDQIVVGDHVYIYYGGYRWGHKAERFTGRQIGFAQLPRDRYVAYRATTPQARLLTPTARLDRPVQLTLNAQTDPLTGELRARVVDDHGQPIPGFDWNDCRPIRGDRIAHPVAWTGRNADLAGRTVAFEFAWTAGQIFAFDLH
jgi:hypothetical protein